MKESSSLGRFLLAFGLLTVFKSITYMPLNSLMMAAMAGLTVLIFDYAAKQRVILTLLLSVSAVTLWTPIAVFSPQLMPMMPMSAGVLSLKWLEFSIFKGQLAHGFFKELYDYVTIAEKTSFLHWHYLAALLMISLVALLWLAYKRGHQSRWFLGIMALTSLLWFLQVEISVAFGILFFAYAAERLTEHGKGLLFGMALPILVVAGALLATVMTPIDAINDYLAEFTSDSGWLRSELMSGGGTRGFDLGVAGYYPLENRLGGPIKPTKEMMFRITTTEKLYLRGRVKAIYQNNQWFSEDEPKGQLNLGQYLPQNTEKLSVKSYRIYDSQLKQTGVLSLLGTLSLDIPLSELAPMQGETMRFKGSVNDGHMKDYTVEGYGVSEGPSQSIYLELPNQYGGEVKRITDEITKGAKSDAEKATRIQNYLLSHFQYALAVEVPPEDKDFVTYFLTEAKQGYCVYFASAATVMNRLAGIPARYVEGFVTFDTYQRGRDQVITGERAHAWAEVYYDKQWHTLETTPTYARATVQTEEVIAVEDAPLPDATTGKQEDAMEQAVVPTQESSGLNLALIFIILGALLLILLVGAVALFKWRGYFNPYVSLMEDETLSPDARLTNRYVVLLLEGLCRHFDIKKAAYLSPGEILREIDEYAPDLGLNGLVEIVNQSLYDSNECDAQSLAAIKEAYWCLFERYYSFSEKASWLMRIAWKGRLRHGFYNEGTTPQH